MITFKIQGAKYKLPTAWADVTYSQYIALLSLPNSLIEYINLFTKIGTDKLLKSELRNLEKISLALSFLTIPPNFTPGPRNIGKYPVPKDVTIESLGQFEDLRGLCNRRPSDISTTENQLLFADLCLEAAAIYIQKVKDGSYNANNVPQVKDDLRNESCLDIIQTGSFFFIQATAYINEYASSLPDGASTPEEIAAGLTRLSEVFGFSATLFEAGERMSVNPEIFMLWPARDFWHMIRYHSWKMDAMREYSKIMSNKA